MLALVLTELLQLQLRGALGDADVRSVIALAARGTFEPDIFSFALFLRHATLFRPVIATAQRIK